MIHGHRLQIEIRPDKKISVFPVTGPKILGRVGTLSFSIIFFLEKNKNLCILKGSLPFKMHKIIYFPENLKQISMFHFRLGRVTLNTGIFYFGLTPTGLSITKD